MGPYLCRNFDLLKYIIFNIAQSRVDKFTSEFTEF